LLPKETVAEAVLELNASDDRGLDVVRQRIKAFAAKKLGLPGHCHKIVILDEADSMTTGAQQALRRIMEIFAGTTRFALACNISSKIIEPVQSRCVILRFDKVPDEDILRMLRRIADAEHVDCTEEGLDAIVLTADGDMRQAINNLQATHHGSSSVITPDAVFRICDQPHPHVLAEVLQLCHRGELAKALTALQLLLGQGHAVTDLAVGLFRVCKLNTTKLPEGVQVDMMRQICLTQAAIADGCPTPLQLLGLLGQLSRPAFKDDHFTI
jgi:replication factor C subunit 2/4